METLQRTANRGSISTGYDIDNSLKMEADNSESMTRTPSSAGNRKTWTLSFWFKRTELGAAVRLFEAWDGSTGTSALFTDADLFILDLTAGGNYFTSSAVFRDTSAWYHFVIRVDTTQGTASERARVYVNGSELAGSWNSNIGQNTDLTWNQNVVHYLGVFHNSGNFANGYYAEVINVDGTSLEPTAFGEFDSDSGIWKPKNASVTYGTNGFKLEFKSSGSLGADTSGNGHTWTLNNITAADQATDTPTNNGCTLNVLASLEGSNDITEGALVSTGGSGSFNGTYGTMGIDPFNSTVDWYWEIEASSTTNGSSDDIGIGWIKESRITSGSTAYNNVYADGISRYSSQTATSAGDIWGVLLETGATPVFKLYRNDSLIHTSTHGSGGVSFDTLMFPYITVKGTGTDARLNFLNPASSFSIASGNTDPNGYGNFEFDTKGGYALCTKNLAEYG
jgi:hypothetical protein